MTDKGDTDYFHVGSADEMSLAIKGSNVTNAKISFMCSLDDIDYYPIEGFSLKAGDEFISSTSDTESIFSFDVSVVQYFKCNIENLDSGELSICVVSFSL